MSKSVNWKQVWLFAGTYIGTIIGSGFATGQELMQFFTYFGLKGIFGSLTTFLIFAFVGAEILNRGRLLKLDDNIKVVSYYAGPYFGKFLEYFIPLFLFGVYVIMISGAGATMNEYYGLNPYAGRVLMSILALGSVVLGLKRMVDVIGNVAPVIVVVTVFVGILSFLHYADQIGPMQDFYASVEAGLAKPAPNAIVSGFLFPAYNMCAVLGVLAGMGGLADGKKECVYGGIMGSVALSASILSIHLALFSQFDKVYELDIPSLHLAKEVSPFLGLVFSVIIMLGIYTTAAPLLWQTANRFVPDSHSKFPLVVIIITLLGFIGGLVPFGTLIGIIYPLTGYIGMVLIALVFFRVIKDRGKEGELLK